MTVYKVGLTGGLASGKSTVAGWLAERGWTVVDADHLVAELYRPGGAGAAAMARLFGEGVLGPDGGVDHAELARRIFSNPAARARVEAAVHPLVRERFEARAAGASGPVVLEATLLVEAGYGPHFDLVATVEAPRERRLEWAVARGMAEAAAEARLRAQGDGATRRAGADVVLYNDGTLDELRRSVDRLAVEVELQAGPRAARGAGPLR